MAACLPAEQVKTFNWMAKKLKSLQFSEIAYHVPASVEKCMKAPSIRVMVRTVGPEVVEAFVDARLVWLIEQMNVANNMTTTQREFAVKSLLETYPNESLADFVLMFKRLAQGFYGNTYHRLDVSVIMEAMQKYIEEKAMYQERDQTTSKQLAAKEETGPDYDAFRKRLEDERIKSDRIKELQRQARIQQISNEYVPPTAEQVKQKEMHLQYLSAKWKHDQDPANRDEKGIKIVKEFMSEDEWIKSC